MPFIILLCPLAYYLKYFHVPVLTPDVMILIGVTLFTGMLFSLALYHAGWVRRTMVLALLLTFAFSFLPAVSSSFILNISFFISLFLIMWLNEKVMPLIAVMASVFLITLLIFPVGKQFNQIKVSQVPQAKYNAALPPIIHIIFDEHIGINAIPTTIGQGKQLQQQLQQFYLKQGFQLYPNAYSHYVRTYDSIPNLVNFTQKAEDAFYFPNGIQNSVLTQNAYFAQLSKQGYKIRVYQADYIDFCHAKGVNYQSCFSYPVFSMPTLYKQAIAWPARTLYLLKAYLLSSQVYQNIMFAYAYGLQPLLKHANLNLPVWDWGQSQLNGLLTLTAMQQLQTDVTQAPAGTVFFAHILLPHSPYMFDAQCHLKPQPASWTINYDEGPVGNYPDRRALRYTQYEDQLRCVYQQLGQMFTAWQQAGVWDKAIIIVQGDHSARVPLAAPYIRNAAFLTQQDFNDSYPTLFAVKAPFMKPGLRPQQLAITYLLEHVMSQLLGQNLINDTQPPYVYLTDTQEDSKVIMPVFPIDQFKPSPAD
jgi:hypothetical protein